MNLLQIIALCLLLVCSNDVQDDNLRDLSGLSESDVFAITDDQELEPGNIQFRKLLYRTGTVDSDVLAQWSARTENTTLTQYSQSPEQFRFYPVSISGNANIVERFDFSAKDAKDFLKGFFVVRCKSGSDDSEFIVVSRSTVSTWPLDEKLVTPQPIIANGFFLGNLSIGSQPAMPVFVARRFSWFPTTESTELEVNASLLALSEAGVDVALLDTVRARKGQPIGVRESNCFWQILSATRSVDFAAAKRIDFASMLGDPVRHVGNAASIQGRIRQCTPVKVTEDNARAMLGTDTWYQLTIFPGFGWTADQSRDKRWRSRSLFRRISGHGMHAETA